MHEPLKDRANGRWTSILAAVGIGSHHLRNKHGPCPLCGGKDRFRYDDKGGNGTWICSHCGAGGGAELVKRYLNVDFKTAAVEIEKHIGSAPVMRTTGQVENDGRTRDEMIAMWKRGRAISLDDAAGQYLNLRTGLRSFPPLSCLRFSPDERYTEAKTKPTWHPTMLALIQPSDAAIAAGEKAALHRTYLAPDGRKAEVSSPRKMIGTIPTGAAVRLMEHDDTLGIAEGIETALSAAEIFNIPTWAALTAGLLERWVPPASVKTVFVYGDNDASNTGQAAAYTLAARLKTKGIEVFVELPPRGQDWNDVHMAKMGVAA